MNALDYLTEAMTPEQQQEFQQALEYLTEKADGSKMGEGSISAMLNKLSPEVQEAFSLISQAMETPRIAPFQSKMTEADHAAGFGFDPATALSIKAGLDAEEVAGRLLERMPNNSTPEPINMRDQIAAALEAHHGTE